MDFLQKSQELSFVILLLSSLENILALLITTDVTISDCKDTLEQETSFGAKWL